MLTTYRVYKGLISRVHSFLIRLINFFPLNKQYECNACHYKTYEFYIYGTRLAGCPSCKSLERERWVNFCLDQKYLSFSTSDAIMHVAPSEKSLVKKFSGANSYFPCDFNPDRYPNLNTKFVNIEKIEQINYFDRIYLSHVLEHVEDDSLALKSIFNALKENGELWLLVPLKIGSSIYSDKIKMSNNNIVEKRKYHEKIFGQWDHNRFYGQDIIEKLKQTGFKVEVIDPSQESSEDIVNYGFRYEDLIFKCIKSNFKPYL